MFSQGITDVLLGDAFMIDFLLGVAFFCMQIFLVSSSLLRCAEFSPVRH